MNSLAVTSKPVKRLAEFKKSLPEIAVLGEKHSCSKTRTLKT